MWRFPKNTWITAITDIADSLTMEHTPLHTLPRCSNVPITKSGVCSADRRRTESAESVKWWKKRCVRLICIRRRGTTALRMLSKPCQPRCFAPSFSIADFSELRSNSKSRRNENISHFRRRTRGLSLLVSTGMESATPSFKCDYRITWTTEARSR